MNRTTRRIALGCFIGGATCTGVAMLVAPMFWLLGLIAGVAAGFAAGYVGYDFMAIVRAVPTAWNKTVATFRKLSATFTAMLSWRPDKERFTRAKWEAFGAFNVCTWTTTIFAFLLYFFFTGAGIATNSLTGIFFISILAFGTLFITLLEFFSEYNDDRVRINRLDKKVAINSFPPITVYLLLIGSVKGLIWGARGLIWVIPRIPRAIAVSFMATCRALRFCVRFTKHFCWQVFLMIHSKERTICAADGTLGGLASFLYIAPAAENLPQQLLAIAFGGLIGVGLGVLNYELVTKRWLVPRGYLNRAS